MHLEQVAVLSDGGDLFLGLLRLCVVFRIGEGVFVGFGGTTAALFD
ncbi:hypothetical protein [Armatimonas sp.]